MFNEEHSLNQIVRNDGIRLGQKYEKIFEALVNESPIYSGKYGLKFSTTSAYQLGKMIEWGQAYDRHVNESGASASDMGKLPLPAIDILAAHYAISIAPLYASMQVLPARQGTIYFKQVYTSGMVNSFPYTNNADGNTNGLGGTKFGPQARGNLNPGTQLVDARTGWVGNAMDYATEQISNEDISASISGGTLSTQLRMFPIRRNIPVRITATDGATTYEGTFLNVDGSNSRTAPLMTSSGWATGDIDFTTGIVNLTINGVTLNGAMISYMQDFETAANLPTIESSLTSMPVMAEYLVLQQMIGTFKQFEFRQTLGKDADADALMDLAGVMADIESHRIVSGYVKMANEVEANPASAGQPIEFDMSVPVGVAEIQHRQSVRYAMAELDSLINHTAGRGAANRYMAGRKMGVFLSGLPDYEAAPVNHAVGPHILGYYQGKPIVRTRYLQGFGAPLGAKGKYEDGMVNPDNVLIGSFLNPGSAFDAPMVVGSYMPLFVTDPAQIGYNMLQSARVIASCKSFTPVVHQYVKGAALYDSATLNP